MKHQEKTHPSANFRLSETRALTPISLDFGVKWIPMFDPLLVRVTSFDFKGDFGVSGF